MADIGGSEKPNKGAESPTTARPLDFDDDQQETGIIQADGSTTAETATPTRKSRSGSRVRFAETGVSDGFGGVGVGGGAGAAAGEAEEEEGVPPPKPPRPTDARQHAENTLIEAFPSVDTKVVKAVLKASGGQVEPAFNALLSMSDPDFVEEAPPPPQPPRPTQQQRQLEQDEMYARQLAEHYGTQRGYGHGPPPQQGPGGGMYRGPGQAPRNANGQEREYSFFDDELPEIRENIRQGFFQTQTKVNKWISDFKKRIDGDDEETGPVAGQASAGQRQDYGPSQSDQLYNIQRNAEAQRARRSTDRERYDADPQVLSDNFTELELRDDEETTPPPKPARRPANPNLFKPTPPPPQTGPVDEVDAAALSSKSKSSTNPAAAAINRQPSPSAGSKSKKWQPLTSVAPNPDDGDNDPFALGDSEDEREKEAKQTDIRAEDSERLKRNASVAEPVGESEGKLKLEPAERSGVEGTRNKDVVDLLEGKSEDKTNSK